MHLALKVHKKKQEKNVYFSCTAAIITSTNTKGSLQALDSDCSVYMPAIYML